MTSLGASVSWRVRRVTGRPRTCSVYHCALQPVGWLWCITIFMHPIDSEFWFQREAVFLREQACVVMVAGDCSMGRQ